MLGASALLVAICFHPSDGQKDLATREQDVIQASMLSVFQPSDWNKLWNKGDQIQISQTYLRKSDGFRIEANKLAEWMSHRTDKITEKRVSLLRKLAKASGPDPASETQPTQPSQMKLDPRITLLPTAFKRSDNLRFATVLDQPAFSGDGKHAILWTHAFPYASDVMFLLDRRHESWTVKFAFAAVYED